MGRLLVQVIRAVIGANAKRADFVEEAARGDGPIVGSRLDVNQTAPSRPGPSLPYGNRARSSRPTGPTEMPETRRAEEPAVAPHESAEYCDETRIAIPMEHKPRIIFTKY